MSTQTYDLIRRAMTETGNKGVVLNKFQLAKLRQAFSRSL